MFPEKIFPTETTDDPGPPECGCGSREGSDSSLYPARTSRIDAAPWILLSLTRTPPPAEPTSEIVKAAASTPDTSTPTTARRTRRCRASSTVVAADCNSASPPAPASSRSSASEARFDTDPGLRSNADTSTSGYLRQIRDLNPATTSSPAG